MPMSMRPFAKTGQTKAYEERKAFHASLASQAEKTRDRIESQISNLDQNPDYKQFDRGCEYLLQWYRNRVGNCDGDSDEDSIITSLGDAQSNSSGLLRVDDDDCNSEDESSINHSSDYSSSDGNDSGSGSNSDDGDRSDESNDGSGQ